MIWTRYILYGLSLPFFLAVSLPLLLVLWTLRLVNNVRVLPDLIVLADISPFGGRMWRYSTTIGRLILINPSVYEYASFDRILAHERVHVRQHEDLMFIAWQVSSIFGPFFIEPWWARLLLWISAGFWPLLMYLSSALRYGFQYAYTDAEHERAAYAQTDPDHFSTTTWLDEHERLMRPEV